jgi:hypothetical protein
LFGSVLGTFLPRQPLSLVSGFRGKAAVAEKAVTTVLHEDVPHTVSLLNCTRHLMTSLEMDRNGGLV